METKKLFAPFWLQIEAAFVSLGNAGVSRKSEAGRNGEPSLSSLARSNYYYIILIMIV